MSLYRNRPPEATSFGSSGLPSPFLSLNPWGIRLLIVLFLLPAMAQAGYWEGMLTTPQLTEKYPPDSPNVSWDGSDLNILCVVQVMDGLGRRQAEELNRFKERLGSKTNLVFTSIDRDEDKKWPLEYIKATWERLKLSVPLYDLTPAARKGIYRGFDPKRIRILPQIIFFNRERTLLRIAEGFHTADELEKIFEGVLSAPADPVPQPVSPASILVNGDFEDWPPGSLLPNGWEVREASPATLVHAERPPGNLVGVAGICRGNTSRRQFLFQRVTNVPDFLGKKVRLSATARSNCIGRPVVALAMPTNEGGRYRFAPESPFVTREGKEIPLRILTACDFEPNTMTWQSLSHETLIPDRGKLFVVVAYLDDIGAPLAAGEIDHITLEVLDK